jgi:hypothetical protein
MPVRRRKLPDEFERFKDVRRSVAPAALEAASFGAFLNRSTPGRETIQP